MLIAALLLFSLLLALGLGLMSSQSARRKAAVAQSDAIAAKSLALAAWADVRTKLGKDLFFPPRTEEQSYFSYGEDVYDKDEEFYGTYTVVVDARYVSFLHDPPGPDDDSLTDAPAGIYLITCVGKLGERGAPPVAERTLYFELAADTFKVIRMHDQESL
jgi:hypothetical protein